MAPKPHLWSGFLGSVQTISSTPAALGAASCSCSLFALSPLNCQSAAPADRSLCFAPPRAEKPISVPPECRPQSRHQTFQTCFSLLPGTAVQSRPLTHAGAGQALQDTPVTHLSAKSPNQIAFVPVRWFPGALRRAADVAFYPTQTLAAFAFMALIPWRRASPQITSTQ